MNNNNICRYCFPYRPGYRLQALGTATFRLLTVLALLISAFSPPCLAAEQAKVFSLLILDSQKGNPYDEIRAALLKTLAGYGYIQGKNLAVTLQVTGNDIKEGERKLRQEISKHHYDVVFAGGTVATISAKGVLFGKMNQPVIFGAATDPVGIGVIKDFSSSPPANFTGVCYPVPPKVRLRFITRLLPKAKTFGLIYADMPQSQSYNQWLKDLVASDPEFKGIQIIFRPIPLITGEDGDTKMAAAAIPEIKALDANVDAFIKPNDQLGTRRPFSEVLYKTATKPLVGIVKDDVMGGWGATAVVYPSHTSIGEQAGRMINQLFTGRKIAEISPEWPKEYGFAVDLPKSKQFKIEVPIELLQLAGENIIK